MLAKISDQNLIFIFPEGGSKIYILNKDLKLTLDGGIILIMEIGAPILTFFLLDKIKVKH